MEIARLILEYLKVLAWPLLVVVLVLVFRRQLSDLLERIQHAEFPGGVKVDIGEQVKDVKRLIKNLPGGVALGTSEAAQISLGRDARPRFDDEARLLELGLRPSPSGLDIQYYTKWLDSDPSMVLAGLRIELEIFASNLAKAFEVPVDRSVVGHRLIQQLQDDHVLSLDQSRLFHKVYRICSDAVHGAIVTRDEAAEVIAAVGVIAAQYRELIETKIRKQ